MTKSGKKFMWLLVIPLSTLIVVTVLLAFFGNAGLAEAISYSGTMLVLLNAAIYIVYVDSKRRWPNLTTFQRFVKVFTFSR